MLYMLINIQILFTVLIVAWAEPFPSDASPAGLISEKGLIQGADDLSKLIIQQDTPPPASNAANFTVTDATPDQIADLEFYVALTAVAYCSSVIPEGRWDCANCRTTLPDAKIITTFSTTVHGTSGFIVRSDDKEAIYLIFRGTDGLRNSIADLDSILVGYPPVQGGTEVHRGFHVSYEEAAPLITTVMGDQLTQYSDYQVVVAGHSLGAALGLLAALDLFQRDSRFTPNNMRIVTAGGPRVGNRKFAYYVDSTDIQFTRIVNKCDSIPHNPSRAKGYLHAGVENWIYDSQDHVRICEANIETNMCSNSILLPISSADHTSYFGMDDGYCM